MSKLNKNRTKTSWVEPTWEEFSLEYGDNHFLSSLSGEITYTQNNGLNQTSIRQYKQFQDQNAEIGFMTPPAADLQLEKAVNENLHGLFDCEKFNSLPDLQLSDLNQIEFNNYLKLNRVVEFQINDTEETRLNSTNAVEFPTHESVMRTGLVFNSGGLPVHSMWCPLKFNDKKYLFLSVVEEDTELSEFSTSSSCIRILEFDNGKFELTKTILLDSVVKEFQFSTISSDSIALLSLTLSNGTIEIWKITQDTVTGPTSFHRVSSGPVILKLDNPLLLLTCCTFSSTDTVIAGTNRGYIAQFRVSTQKLDYLIPTKTCGITNIKCFLPVMADARNLSVTFSSSDFSSYFMKLPLPNFRSSILNNIALYEIGITNKDLMFDRNTDQLSNLKTVLSVEHPNYIRVSTISNPSSMWRYRLDNDKDISCIAVQKTSGKIQENGLMVFTGHSNGSVRLFNFFNVHTTYERKYTSSSIRLMKMNRSAHNPSKFWLDLNYEVGRLGDIVKKDPFKQVSIAKTRNIRIVDDIMLCPLCVSSLDNSVAVLYDNGLVVLEELLV